MSKIKYITLLGLFLALGLIIPFVTSHGIGLPGNVLLPMHLPVLLTGYLLGPSAGLLLGIITPVLSGILTGMPPIFLMPIMAIELGLYGMFTGLFYHKLKLNVFTSLVLSLILGKIGYGLTLFVLINLFNLTMFTKTSTVVAAAVTGLPGIIIQLILIPVLVKLLKPYMINE